MVASGAIKVVGGKEMVANAGAFEALAKIGGAMFAEDSMNSSPTVGNNPFDPKTENLTAQGKIIKENPERAKLLINAAGPQAVAIHKWWMDRASPK